MSQLIIRNISPLISPTVISIGFLYGVQTDVRQCIKTECAVGANGILIPLDVFVYKILKAVDLTGHIGTVVLVIAFQIPFGALLCLGVRRGDGKGFQGKDIGVTGSQPCLFRNLPAIRICLGNKTNHIAPLVISGRGSVLSLKLDLLIGHLDLIFFLLVCRFLKLTFVGAGVRASLIQGPLRGFLFVLGIILAKQRAVVRHRNNSVRQNIGHDRQDQRSSGTAVHLIVMKIFFITVRAV